MREVNDKLIKLAASKIAKPGFEDETYRLLSLVFSASDDNAKVYYLEELSGISNKTEEEIIGSLQKIDREQKLSELGRNNGSR